MSAETKRQVGLFDPPEQGEQVDLFIHRPAAEDSPLLAGLDPEQRAAAQHTDSPVLLLAGPGAGKTRALTHRLAWLVVERGVPPERCLALTFTRGAARDLRERLTPLMGSLRATQVQVHTFHSLALSLLHEHSEAAGLEPGFRLADDWEQLQLLEQALGLGPGEARRLMNALRTGHREGDMGALVDSHRAYRQELATHNLLDANELVLRCVELLRGSEEQLRQTRLRSPWISVDALQNIDATQLQLLRLLAPPGASLCAAADPGQRAHRFQSVDPDFFLSFAQELDARVLRLRRNYRSGRRIAAAARQVLTGGAPPEEDPSVWSSSNLRVRLHSAANASAEAEFLVDTVKRLLGSPEQTTSEDTEPESAGLQLSDIAVLYRSEALLPPLRDALSRAELPFVHRSHRLLARHVGVQELVGRFEEGEVSLSEQLERLTEQLYAEAADAESPLDAQSIQEAVELLSAVVPGCDSVDRLRELLATTTQLDLLQAGAPMLSLLTLHASKGLQFKAVFILGCEDGVLPLRFGVSDPDELERERRLLYVGMTRAQEVLYLLRAEQRSWGGRQQQHPPSPFLAHIDPSLTVTVNRQEPQHPAVEPTPQIGLFSGDP